MQAVSLGQFTLTSPEHSVSFAKALASILGAGDTVLLSGEIGAGKSVLSRAIIQTRLAAENRMEDVPSPTFTLVQVYELENVEIWHCDLYRLSSIDEVVELGLEDAFETAICLIEWPDRLGVIEPGAALGLSLSASHKTENTRTIEISARDPAWSKRLAPVLEVFAQ